MISKLNGRVLVFDSVLPRPWMNQAFSFIQGSLFQIGWQDTPDVSVSNHKYLHSVYNHEDIDNIGILDQLKGSDIWAYIEGLSLLRSVVNLSIPTETHFAHTHAGLTLLYYPNLRWQEEWAGETLFYSDDLSEVIYTSSYTPGRIILFDGDIPHTLRPQSGAAPEFRYTLALQFAPIGGKINEG